MRRIVVASLFLIACSNAPDLDSSGEGGETSPSDAELRKMKAFVEGRYDQQDVMHSFKTKRDEGIDCGLCAVAARTDRSWGRPITPFCSLALGILPKIPPPGGEDKDRKPSRTDEGLRLVAERGIGARGIGPQAPQSSAAGGSASNPGWASRGSSIWGGGARCSGPV